MKTLRAESNVLLQARMINAFSSIHVKHLYRSSQFWEQRLPRDYSKSKGKESHHTYTVQYQIIQLGDGDTQVWITCPTTAWSCQSTSQTHGLSDRGSHIWCSTNSATHHATISRYSTLWLRFCGPPKWEIFSRLQTKSGTIHSFTTAWVCKHSATVAELTNCRRQQA